MNKTSGVIKALYIVAIVFASIYFLSIAAHVCACAQYVASRHNDFYKPAYYAWDKVDVGSSASFSVYYDESAKKISYFFYETSGPLKIAKYIKEYLTLNTDNPLNDGYSITLDFSDELYGSRKSTVLEIYNYHEGINYGNCFNTIHIYEDGYYKLKSGIFYDEKGDLFSEYKYISWDISNGYYYFNPDPNLDLGIWSSFTGLDTIYTNFSSNYNYHVFSSNVKKIFPHVNVCNTPQFTDDDGINIDIFSKKNYYTDSCIYVSEGDEYAKYYVFDIMGGDIGLIRADVLDEPIAFFEYKDDLKMEYSKSYLNDYLTQNVYNMFDEDVKNIIKPANVKDFGRLSYKAPVFILSKEQINVPKENSDDFYRKVIKYIQPGTWVRTPNGKSAVYQFKDIFDDEPRFVSIKYWEKGYVQPVFSVEYTAKIQLSDKVIPSEFVWVFKGDAP